MHSPDVPVTLEGWSVLHQMFRVRWRDFRDENGPRHAAEAAATLSEMEARGDAGATVVCQVLGHKADLMLIHFRRSFEELAETQAALTRLSLHDFLEPTTSYVSLVELGQYELTAKIHERLRAANLEAGSDAWRAAMNAELAEQAERQKARLWPAVPAGRFVCFYPMDKKRQDGVNWFSLSMEERIQLMRGHGRVGRMYAGQVTQIISGSIGLDDWEWGVDLFADDPLVFKRLIHEMRFDAASALYAKFGPFYVGLRFPASELPSLLAGKAPQLVAKTR